MLPALSWLFPPRPGCLRYENWLQLDRHGKSFDPPPQGESHQTRLQRAPKARNKCRLVAPVGNVQAIILQKCIAIANPGQEGWAVSRYTSYESSAIGQRELRDEDGTEEVVHIGQLGRCDR